MLPVGNLLLDLHLLAIHQYHSLPHDAVFAPAWSTWLRAGTGAGRYTPAVAQAGLLHPPGRTPHHRVPVPRHPPHRMTPASAESSPVVHSADCMMFDSFGLMHPSGQQLPKVLLHQRSCLLQRDRQVLPTYRFHPHQRYRMSP